MLKQPASHEWATPQEFFDTLNGEFQFTLDAAADESNHKTERYYGFGGLGLSGLAHSWSGEVVWCNPPYGTFIGDWVSKAHEESTRGTTVVMLIPARTDTAYWHDYCMRAAEIRLVRGRLVFGESANSAPFPSAVVVFRPGWFGTPKLSAIERSGQSVMLSDAA
ncbi:MAG: phage N-6-adenine-methyltransferase [Chloroflexota bacterium]|nr:phage N-6-adenine-methyltransferase [Chloroflexota bacterium]